MTYKNISHTEPVAIVGIGCRFPGAKGPREFWRLLIDGVDAITEVPASRFDINAFYDPTPGAAGKISSRFGGFIADVENFDAGFFGISPREAEAMDPQQRLLIEIAYEALEDAGLPPDREGMSGAGVFLGMMSDDYLRQTYRSADLDLTMAAGGSRGTAAARISYALGFQGPSMTVDSDRASSLTALHLACQSLRAKECSVALVGACNLILSPELSIACSRSGILSSDGRCKFGDARADGIVRSEGCGVLVLKPLSHALRENDRVYAIVRGSAVANNGSSSMELMRPSVQAQETLLRAALRDAGVSAGDLLYVEAHGTGTRVGDKVEAEALGAVFGGDRPIARPCLIGSVKTNIGHAEAAGGMAGVIKVALALQHGLIPKSLHFEQENPELNLHERRLRVQTETGPWPLNDGHPALAGVSAFGLTGTIAHVVLQAAPAETRCTSSLSADGPTAHLLPISARSAESLDSMVSAYRDWLEGSLAPESFARACYSASVHRQHHPHRAGFVASSARELREQLDAYLKGSELHHAAQGHAVPGKTAKLAFIFPGQGGQGIGMGRELLVQEPVFRHTVELCDEAVRSEAGWSVLGLLRGEAPDSLLDEIDYLQPTLTSVMVALAALWQSWGIEPDATLGLSMGEAAAAHVAGMLDIPDTMAVVCRRARLLKRLRGKGAILSTPLTFAEAEKALVPYRPQLSIAVVASPTNTLLSGDPLSMKALADELESRGLPCRFVKSDVAGHSAQMDPLLDELRAELASLKPRKGSIPLASTVDDTYLTGTELDADYWARNLRHTVLQMNGVGRLLQDGYTTFLEVSPHPVAWNPLWETIRHFGADATAIASLRRDEGERESLLKAAGALYVQGFSPNWAALFREVDKQFVPLPTYQWDDKPCWFKATTGERPVTAKTSASAAPVTPRPGARTRFLDQLKRLPSAQRRKFLLDHLRGMVGQILRLPDSSLPDCGAPLRQLGLTSLMATELALELERTLEYPCSATIAFNYPTIEKLTDHLLSEGVGDSATSEAASHAAAGDGSAAEMISGMRPIPEGLPSGQGDQVELAEPIAIIGLACRFPGGAVNPEDYWRILRGGVDAITEVPSDRWNISDFYDTNPEAPGKMYSRWGGFLDSIDLFDAGYFGISPREAAALDPQQRLLLEVTVEALENAGQAPDPQSASNSGVFVGIMNNNDFVSVKKISSDLSRVNAHDSTGQATSAAAGRLSYALGFQGPSMAVDTACSSSLVAIHLACQSLRSKECRMAVAGGVNVILAPEVTISFCKTRMLSPTGRCKTFDSRADGYVRGEGCGMIVLKRLSDAVRDKDNILALIRGSAVNQDGRSSSLTAPNGLAQQALLRQALSVAGVRPSEVDYIEAHGTGTALGDPIELEALGKVLGEGRDSRHPFLVGSVKTNIGHLESAAGVAGLIKVILSLQNQEIPPHLHLREVNPRISLNASNASIPTRLTPWARNGKPRVAGVSSFGFVGTNAHVVIEEAPEALAGKAAGSRPVHRLLALSARSPEGLRELAGRYSRMLSRRSVDIDDLCYTANTGRVHHEVRAAITASSTDALREKLARLSGDDAAHLAASGVPGGKIAFLFTGQGSQYQFMGRNLFAVEPVFRAALERCAGIIDPLLQRSLLSVINNEDPELLYQTQFAQPALFALEYAVFEQWRAWGIEPAMVMGHSLGEYTAAVAAQVLTLEQAAKLVVTRGRLMQSIQTPGGSAAIFASEDFVRPFVEPYRDSVAIAADNAPERVLIAGEQKHLQMICDELKAKGVEVRSMVGLVGPHCPLMDPILDTFETIAAMAHYNPPAIPMVSTGTAQVMTAADVSNPRHWRDLIRNKVRFREGMQVLHDAGCRTFLEIGPRHTLIRLGEMCLPMPGLTWLASLSKEKHDQEQMLESLGQLYTRGARVDWAERHRPFAGRKVALPTTIFEGRPFWPEKSQPPVSTLAQAAQVRGNNDGRTQLLGQRLRSPLEEVQFEARVDLASLPMLEDHRILGTLLMPGAGHIVRVLSAAEQLTGRRRLELRDALFPEPMMLGDPSDARVAQLVLTPKEDGYDFKISSVAHADENDSGWRVHATGHILAVEDENGETETALTPGIEEEVSKLGPEPEEFSGEDFYAAQATSGYALGPTFRWLERVWVGPDDGLATLRMPRELAESTWRGLHPGLIDSCIQVASRVANTAPEVKDAGVLVPAAVSGFQLFGHGLDQALQGDLYCRIFRLGPREQDAPLKLSVVDQSGKPIFSIARLHLRRLSSRDLLGGVPANFDESFRRIAWSDSSLIASSANGQGKWLIFADEGGTGAALAERLRDRGQDSVLVLKAQEHIKNGHFLRVNAANQPEFNRQLAQMQTDYGASWQGIVYLWGLDATGNSATECLPGEETSHSLGLLNLVKAMINASDCPPVWVVTRGAQRTQRESKLGAIGQAMLWGMGRVFASEHSALLGGLVDLDPHAVHEDDAAQLLEELWAQDSDTQVAYRSGKRLAPRLSALGRGRSRSRFHARNDASYLITGAFGALGRKVAEWLVASGARHLALISRRPPDEEARGWLQGLKEQGVQVLPLQTDVAVMAELAEALARLDRTMPPLRGVMHAAGILDDSVFSKLEWPGFARVHAPKSLGSWNLHTLTADRPLDFWVIFSSVTALLGNPGQAAYVAGNAYADALVHHRRMQGLPALSINWGPWEGDGMSAHVVDDLYRRWGLLAIDPREGVEMLGQLLNVGGGQVWAAPFEIDVLKKRLAESPHLALVAEMVGGQERTASSARGRAGANSTGKLQDLPDDQRRAAVLEHVVDMVRSVTGMEASEPVRADARFETLGVDSLLTLDLLNALSRFFGVNLPSTIFINCPTVELLVKYLCEETAISSGASASPAVLVS